MTWRITSGAQTIPRPAAQVRRGAAVVFATAFCIGQYLVYLAGWPIFVVGVVSILAGYAYSSGPRPIAYTSLGEFFVLVFFGWVAVGGTWFAHTQFAPGLVVMLAGAAVGLPAAAVLVVNNTRDAEDDRRAGRRTFPVVYGTSASRLEYGAFVVASPLLAAWASLETGAGAWALVCLAVLPAAARLVSAFGRAADGNDYNRLLEATARYGLLTGTVLVAVLVITA
jgi:1,4-dihydroxy-2-naphthoate octaprenyltransferase